MPTSPVVKPFPAKTVQASTALRHDCRVILEELARIFPGLACAVVATADGREFANVLPAGSSLDAQKIAAISSSLLALAESFGREALRSGILYNTIATTHGSIVVVRILSRRRMHVLCLCADSTENLAMSIRFALDTAEMLASTIDSADHD